LNSLIQNQENIVKKENEFLQVELSLVLKKIRELKIQLIELKYSWIEMVEFMMNMMKHILQESTTFIAEDEKQSLESDLLLELSKIDSLENELKQLCQQEELENEEMNTLTRQKKIMIKQLKTLKK
jgi:hypothetical protein